MKTYPSACHSLMFLAIFMLMLSVSSVTHAQQFAKPNPDELSMTADPKAPGADAVYLDIEETTDDGRHFHSFYARIKVLQEKGKELATVEIPYENSAYAVNDIKARTIHADGTIIPMTVKPEDLLSSKSGENVYSRRVFSLPSVEVGSILEYRYDLSYDENTYSSPFWEIQQPYFIHHAHYGFTPFKAFLKTRENITSHYLEDSRGRIINMLMYWPVLPAGSSVINDATGRFSLDLTDIPPLPKEDWMPPIESLRYKVFFYYRNADNAVNFWVEEAKLWSKDVDHFANPSGEIRAAVNDLIAPGDSELDKAKKFYQAVQALDNTDYSRKKEAAELKQLKLRVAKEADDTWKQKSGSSQDITLLYLTMLRAAGLTAYDMKVVNREQAVFTPDFLYFDQLTDDLIDLKIDGKDILLDPGEKLCPFQTVNWRHSNVGGISQYGQAPTLVTTPGQDYAKNTLMRAGDVTLDDQGSITGSFNFVMNGQEALSWRQAVLLKDLDEVKKGYDRWLEEITPSGVHAHVDHFIGLDDPDVNLVAVVKVQGVAGTVTAKRILLPGFFFESRGRQPFVNQEKRMEPVDMHYGEKITDQVVYHLPAGYTIEAAPKDANTPWPQHAVFVVKTKTEAGQITIARQLARAFSTVKADDYQTLRGFYQKVASSDQQQLILTKSTVSQGN